MDNNKCEYCDYVFLPSDDKSTHRNECYIANSIPCEICSSPILFSNYEEHVSTCGNTPILNNMANNIHIAYIFRPRVANSNNIPANNIPANNIPSNNNQQDAVENNNSENSQDIEYETDTEDGESQEDDNNNSIGIQIYPSIFSQQINNTNANEPILFNALIALISSESSGVPPLNNIFTI